MQSLSYVFQANLGYAELEHYSIDYLEVYLDRLQGNLRNLPQTMREQA